MVKSVQDLEDAVDYYIDNGYSIKQVGKHHVIAKPAFHGDLRVHVFIFSITLLPALLMGSPTYVVLAHVFYMIFNRYLNSVSIKLEK